MTTLFLGKSSPFFIFLHSHKYDSHANSIKSFSYIFFIRIR